MKRLYTSILLDHFQKYRQMVFLSGPRQVGKTTLGKSLGIHPQHYFNWDDLETRELIIGGQTAIAKEANLQTLSEQKPLIIFDELHKYSKWKNFLKGFFDLYEKKSHILLTGSSQLDFFNRTGDSMMGRYFSYRLHPLSVAESLHYVGKKKDELIFEPRKVPKDLISTLLQFGGFPEPFTKGDKSFYHRWSSLRQRQLLEEDLRSLTKIQEVSLMELLLKVLQHQVGQLTSYTSLSKKVGVSIDTIKRWIKTLEAFYFCFAIKPYSTNITRSLLKEPKYYLWDWSLVKDMSARYENFVASHLLKVVHFYTDLGLGNFDLFFLRDKDQREVDFLVTRDGQPWFLVEVKSSHKADLSPSLSYYQKQTNANHAFQVVFDLPHEEVDCFSENSPCIVPVSTLLSQFLS